MCLCSTHTCHPNASFSGLPTFHDLPPGRGGDLAKPTTEYGFRGTSAMLDQCLSREALEALAQIPCSGEAGESTSLWA